MITKHKSIITTDPGQLTIFISREFDAPPEVVFKAFIDPKLYVQWIGPRGLSTTIQKFEAKNGGSWRFTQKDSNGNEFAFHGVFHEVTAPKLSAGLTGRIIQTFEFEGLPETGHVILDTTKFESLPIDRTRMLSQSVFQSVEDRDGMLESGMEQGVDEGYERLDELLEKVQK
jgi:uncharacterized protein YndB with AHSA1/START domain